MLRFVQLLLPLFYLLVTNVEANGTNSLKLNNACISLIDYPIKDLTNNCYYNPNVFSNTQSMILQNGYNYETHLVTTKDGYILELFRIPPKQDDNRKNKQPVLLVHGILTDSATWVSFGKRSLAFHLSEEGYDVWLFNERGTRYSKNHTKLSQSDFLYWIYSIDDLALNDIPVTLHKVLNVTGQPAIYFGHSRGSTIIFMYASQFPNQAKELVRGVVAFSPIVYLDFVWYLKYVASVGPLIGKFLLSLKISVLLYPREAFNDFLLFLCTFWPHICRVGLDLASGRTTQILAEDLLAIYSYFPSTIAVQQLIQYCQIYNSGQFQKYDYGKARNLLKYKQEKPPLYNLTDITVPVYLFYGKHDILITKKAVTRVYNELGSAEKRIISVPKGIKDDKLQFGHSDFLWAKNITSFLYEDLSEVLNLLV